MSSELARGESIPWLISELLDEQGEVSSGEVAKAAGVTRQAVHYHLRRLVDAGELEAVGAGRSSKYIRSSIWSKQFEITGLEEDIVWRELAGDVKEIKELRDPALGTAKFAFTEMLNNAIDHSGSETVTVSLSLSEKCLKFSISDEGVGAFERVRRTKNLEDRIAAIQEISKGKLTTDPQRHSGQGIFFTSKAVELFSLSSNGLRWVVDNTRNDVAVGRALPQRGTQVRFVVDPQSQRSLKKIFDEYTDEETFAFDKSRTVVSLFEYDVSFVSRSEAKRLTRNLDQFAEVVVDFRGVDEIGQGFADEVFRVWQQDHPDVGLTPVNMNESVRRLVEQVRSR